MTNHARPPYRDHRRTVVPLTEWPDHFQDDPEPRGEIVECVFDEEICVTAKTEKAIGLTYGEDDEISFWIPISQIDGDVPDKGDWIEEIRIPAWLAEEKGLV